MRLNINHVRLGWMQGCQEAVKKLNNKIMYLNKNVCEAECIAKCKAECLAKCEAKCKIGCEAKCKAEEKRQE